VEENQNAVAKRLDSRPHQNLALGLKINFKFVSSMLLNFIYDTTSVQDRLLQAPEKDIDRITAERMTRMDKTVISAFGNMGLPNSRQDRAASK